MSSPIQVMPTLSQDAQTYYNETSGAIKAQSQIMPQAIDKERQMLPGMQQYWNESMGSQYQHLLGQYGNMQGFSSQAQGGYQNQLLGMYGHGGQMATQSAINNLGYAGAQNYNMFQQQAGQGLMMGSSLSPQETMQAQQSAREAMARRGLTGNQAIGQEVLNSYQLGNQRQQQRQQMATQAYGMASGQQQFGQAAYLNPAIQQSQGVYGLGQMYGATQSSFQNLGPQFLQPESQYLANIRGNRVSQENAARAANAQRDSGMMGGIGSIIGGAVAMFCWVAREVYGTETGEWIVFRQWVLNEAPTWFRELYTEHGEQFAKFISDKPFIKSIVRCAMNVIVKPRLNLIKFYA